MAEDNTIYVGNKPVMNYVLATVTQFNNGSESVIIKARGRAISRAVDTVEVTRKRFLPTLKLEDIRIGTEKLEGERGGEISVSFIELVLGSAPIPVESPTE